MNQADADRLLHLLEHWAVTPRGAHMSEHREEVYDSDGWWADHAWAVARLAEIDAVVDALPEGAATRRSWMSARDSVRVGIFADVNSSSANDREHFTFSQAAAAHGVATWVALRASGGRLLIDEVPAMQDAIADLTDLVANSAHLPEYTRDYLLALLQEVVDTLSDLHEANVMVARGLLERVVGVTAVAFDGIDDKEEAQKAEGLVRRLGRLTANFLGHPFVSAVAGGAVGSAAGSAVAQLTTGT